MGMKEKKKRKTVRKRTKWHVVCYWNFQVEAWRGTGELAEHHWECHHIRENRPACDIH